MEETREQRIERQKGEIEKLKEEILNDLSAYAVSEDTAGFTKVVITSDGGDHEDGCLERFVFIRKEDAIDASYEKINTWIAGQVIRESVEKTLSITEENRKLFSMLCDEVIATSDRPRSFDYGEVAYMSQILGEKRVKSKYVTPKTLAILSIWFALPDDFLSEFDAFHSQDAENGEDDGYEYKVAAPADPMKDLKYKFTYRSGGEERSFRYRKNRIETEIRKGEKRRVKERYLRDHEIERYKAAFSDLMEWTNRLSDTRDDGAPFTFFLEGKGEMRTSLLDKKILDLMNYLAPEPLTIPDALVKDGHDSVYVRAGAEVPDEAYMGNRSIRYLRIFADETKSIGKRAFMGSSLANVDLLPEFFSYAGTGGMPRKIGADAFADCRDLDVMIDGQDVYLGTPFLSSRRCEYTLKIATLKSESDKERYNHAKADAKRSDREFMLSIIANCEENIKYAADSLMEDREFVLAVVKRWGRALKYLPDRFKSDKTIVLAAVMDDVNAIEFVSEPLRNDRDVVKALVTNYGGMLRALSDAWKKDREIVLSAVQSTGRALEYADPSLRADKTVVLAAVTRDPAALEFASAELQKDPDVLDAANTKKSGGDDDLPF